MKPELSSAWYNLWEGTIFMSADLLNQSLHSGSEIARDRGIVLRCLLGVFCCVNSKAYGSEHHED
jgi:hypothetical protein